MSTNTADLIKQIRRYQNNILQVNPPENDTARVLHYLRKLAKLPIKLDELEETGVGKTINALRKSGGRIAEEATLLVAKWKAIVKKQVEEEEALEEQYTDDSASDNELSGAETQTIENKKLKQSSYVEREITLKHENSDRKRKHSDEKNNEIKKDKYKKSENRTKPQEKDCEPRSIVKEQPAPDVEKKKKQKQDDRKHRKDEKHHKSSSKHESKSHHSKSSHHEKKRSDEENESKKDKKSKSKSNHECNRKKKSDRNSSKVLSDKTKQKISNSSNLETASDFGAALLSIPDTISVSKKQSSSSRSSNYTDSPRTPFSSKNAQKGGELRDIDSIKLEPSDIEENLKMSPDDYFSSRNDYSRLNVAKSNFKTEEDMFKSMITNKNQKTKVFSGNKVCINAKFPTLFELSCRVLQDNFDALEFTGGVPYEVLKPILEKVSVQQLYTFENFNPYLIGETDELWEYHAKKEFRKAERLEYESWRELYLRCIEEREEKLQSLTENINQSIANSTPIRKTKLAFIDSVVKPPRGVAKNQTKYGTGNSNSKSSPKGSQCSNSASQSVKERLIKESLAPAAISIPSNEKEKSPSNAEDTPTIEDTETVRRLLEFVETDN